MIIVAAVFYGANQYNLLTSVEPTFFSHRLEGVAVEVAGALIVAGPITMFWIKLPLR